MRRLVIIGVALLLVASNGYAFPPYRSTDADTAGNGVIQLRLGLLRIKRKDSVSERSTPLTRMNLGVGDHFELVSEFEYSPDQHRVGEGALEFKWARLDDRLGIGVEALALIPVHSGQSGKGIESQFITTLARERWQIHFNAGRSALVHDGARLARQPAGGVSARQA